MSQPVADAGPLHQVVRQWQPVLEAIPTGMSIFDADGLLVLYNDCALRLWGQAPAAGTAGLAGAWVAEVLRTGQKLRDCEEDIERADGTRLTLLLDLDPLHDRAGTLIGAICCFRDITRRRADERYMRQVLNALPAAVYTTDASGKITFYNDAAIELAGRRPEFGDEWCVTWRLYRPDGTPLPHDQCPMAEALREARPIRGREIVAERPDGSRAHVAPYPTPLRNEAGELIGAVNMLVDLTESKAAEAAMRESEQRFRRVFEQSPVGKAVAGPDFGLISVNPALCHMLGYDEAELIGRNFLDLVHPDDRASCSAAGHALRNGEIEQVQLEERYLQKSGEPIWVSITVGPIRDAAGRFLSGLAVIENIDDRKRMTEALRLSEQRLREFNNSLEMLAEERARQLASSQAQLQTFFHNSPDWLTMQRVGSDGGIVYVDLNATCEAAYGLSRDQVIGRPLGEILGHEAAAVPTRHIHECVRSGTSQRYVARRTLAGRTRTIDVMVTPVPGRAEDGGQLIITTARDITERDELEAQLRQSQKMEIVGQLTGGVAHDFNNLLTAILGNLELLKMRSGDAQNVKQINAALRAAQRGARLTEQLLAFSRRQHLRPEPVDVNAVLHGMLDLVARSIGPNVSVKTALVPELWPAMADRTQLEAAILNLAINARDAMPQGGAVVIETRNVALPDDRLREEIGDCDCIEISVRDTGTGMSEEIMARAVEPFFTTKESGKGSGLGLSQVYGLAQQSGGTLRLESRVGSGTTARLYLPRSTALSLQTAEDTAARPDRKRAYGHILVVDDEADVREIAAQMLRNSGYSVTEIGSGEAALDALSRGDSYDLVVIDVAMPGLGGIETLRRARLKWPRLPALLMTGYIPTQGSGLDEARDPMIKKPFALADLAGAVERTLDPMRADPGASVVPMRSRRPANNRIPGQRAGQDRI